MHWYTKMLRFWPWLAAVASGLLYRGCFAPFDQAWLCWIALTPLLAAVWFSGADVKRRWLRDLLLGYLAGAVFFWGVFSWLTTVTVPGMVLVGFYMGLYLAAWAWLCGALRPGLRQLSSKTAVGLDAVTQRLAAKRAAEQGVALSPTSVPLHPLAGSDWLSSVRNLRLAFLVASAWVTVEALRGIIFSGWDWNSIGSALHAQPAMIQIVEYTGVPGLSFLVVFVNVILVATVRRFMLEAEVKPVRPHYDLTLTMAAILGVMGFGLRALQNPSPSVPVHVAAVQPNIPREQKFNAEFAQATFDKFSSLSQLALQGQPDLLVWPESAMPGPVLQDEVTYRFVTEFSAAAKTDLLLGALDLDETGDYNAALLVSAAGQSIQIYHKVHLVPFGEYVPGRHTLPGIGAIVGDQVPSDFSFGKEHTVFQLTRADVRVAPLICFEDTIGDLTRQFVLRGANLLVNVTNDGWFQRSAGSQQHLANAIFRCVETRLPMVRAANTGVTCFINEFGRVTQVLLDDTGSQFTEGILSGDVRVPTNYQPTFYVRYGEVFEQAGVAITGLTLLFLGWRFVRQRAVGKKSALVLALLGSLCATSAHAYGPDGHQIVGAIADERLANSPTGEKIRVLLQGFSLQKASIIPDEIKGWDKKGVDDPTIFRYNARPLVDAQLADFWRANPPTRDHASAVPSHHWFHYTDVPVVTPQKYAEGKAGRREWDIVHMMRYCIRVLRGEEPEENARKITKPIAIILLAHFVGDIHQPLHVGAEFFDAKGNPTDPDKSGVGFENQGGNTITLRHTVAAARKFLTAYSKLHGYWDSLTVAMNLPEFPELEKEERRLKMDAARRALVLELVAKEPAGWRPPAELRVEEYPELWANEILPIAREAHQRLSFSDVRIETKDGESLAVGSAQEKAMPDGVGYYDWSAKIVRQEMHQAGWRLADLLEKSLP